MKDLEATYTAARQAMERATKVRERVKEEVQGVAEYNKQEKEQEWRQVEEEHICLEEMGRECDRHWQQQQQRAQEQEQKVQ